jgi:hypothetical protein
VAKFSSKNTFTNAVLNLDEMTITEFTKDEVKVYDLQKILQQWDGVDGISLTIAKTADITPDE